jgi:hypothetical protein
LLSTSRDPTLPGARNALTGNTARRNVIPGCILGHICGVEVSAYCNGSRGDDGQNREYEWGDPEQNPKAKVAARAVDRDELTA